MSEVKLYISKVREHPILTLFWAISPAFLPPTEYTTLPKIPQHLKLFFFIKYPKPRSLCHDKDFNLRGVFGKKTFYLPDKTPS
jgi:hypothetical protein